MNGSFRLVCALALLSFSFPAGEDRARAARAHANRGVAYLEQFRFEDAVSEFEKVVTLTPDRAAAHVNLALALFNQRDFDRAAESLRKAEALDPENIWVHYNLGLIWKLEGKTEEARAAFEKVAAADPSDPMTQYYLGTLYASQGRLKEAEEHLRGAIRLQPSNESAHFGLGNALIRAGAVEEGKKELEIFRELKESFPAEAASAGLQYTELGKYAEAIEESGAPLQPASPAAEAGAASWVDVTEAWGLGGPLLPAPPPWPTSIAASEYGREWVEKTLLPHFGGGLAFRDLDGDDDPDLFALRGGVLEIFRNDGGRFSPVSTGLPETARYVGLTLGDIDNDGDPDIYLAGPRKNTLLLNDGKGSFTDATDAFRLSSDDLSVAAALADVDHDGDLDIYVSNYADPTPRASGGSLRVPWDLPGAPNRLYRNNGNGSFTEIGRESRTDAGAGRSLGAIFSDLDDDRDVDFVVVNDGEPAQAFSNDRVGTFTEKAAAWGIEISGRFRGVATADFDRDGRVDLFFTAEGSTLNALFRGAAPFGFKPDLLSPDLLGAGVPGGRFSTQFLDADNDTDLDLFVVSDDGATLFESTPSGYRRSSPLAMPQGVGQGRALAVADIDGDGDLDFALTTDRGRVLLFRNDFGNAKSALRVKTRGLRSNRDGIGAKVEVKVSDSRQRREVQTSTGFLSQNELPLHFGLGDQKTAASVRFLWPGGVKQIEIEPRSGQTLVIEELNRKGTSCPILYAWDGKAIRFVTDFLGGSAVGYLLAPGTYNTPDTDEYVKLEEFPVEPREGSYDLRFLNQLEEVLLYDRAALLAVDHPADVFVFPNERLMPGPPFPKPRLYTVDRLRPPVRATDHRGKDVTELLTRKDRRYAGDFELLPFKGYAAEHALTLDLGTIAKGEHVVLLLYGFVDYADSSANVAASQAGVTLLPPRLDVADGKGGFREGLRQMGFPAGLPKTMLVDLEGLADLGGPDLDEVRIVTSMRIYWDQIQVATVRPDVSPRVTELSPDRAELRFHGFPTAYDYSRSVATELWDHHRGAYTRYGDVRQLVAAVDDRYVITKNGDELALGFEAKKLPPLPPGWRRSFILLADGYGKDMDLNSAYPDTVEPLPFHGMSSYPYPPAERYPDAQPFRRYRETYNTRRP